MKNQHFRNLCLCMALLITALSLIGCGGEVILETDIYTIRQIDGHRYIDVKAGNQWIDLYDGGCVIPSPYLSFDTLADLHDFLKSGEISQDELETIQYGFPLDEDRGFLIAAPETLYSLELASAHKLKWLDLSGEQFIFHIRADESDSADFQFSGQYRILPEADFRKEQADYNRFCSDTAENTSTYTVPEKNAVVYECKKESGTWQDVQYTLESQDKILYVTEKYIFETEYDLTHASEAIPTELKIYGIENGVCFVMSANRMTFRPTEEWLNAIRVKKYQ